MLKKYIKTVVLDKQNIQIYSRNDGCWNYDGELEKIYQKVNRNWKLIWTKEINRNIDGK